MPGSDVAALYGSTPRGGCSGPWARAPPGGGPGSGARSAAGCTEVAAPFRFLSGSRGDAQLPLQSQSSFPTSKSVAVLSHLHHQLHFPLSPSRQMASVGPMGCPSRSTVRAPWTLILRSPSVRTLGLWFRRDPGFVPTPGLPATSPFWRVTNEAKFGPFPSHASGALPCLLTRAVRSGSGL